MLPININDGFRRYVLVRAGRASRNAEALSPTRARAVLEAVLSHRQSRLLHQFAELLHMYGADPQDVVARALDQLAAGQLMMIERPRERLAPAPQREAELPSLPEQPPEEPEEEQEEEPPEARTSVRISLFFDGTGNNRTNTQERLDDTEVFEDNEDEGSFLNDFTNVSRLETRLIGDSSFEHSFSVYVEGIGTTDREGDSSYGMGTGLGGTGVVAKVRAGIREVLRGLRGLGLASGEIIERLHLDAFGFSRGAAAARHFTHLVLNGDPLQPQVEDLGHPVEELAVHFVGLFDTVASYGVQHSNDTRDLDLDAIRSAQVVVQLAAAEEHRKNFRLTNIDSAVAAGVGTEIFLPGVHSDIGGGYTDHYDEVELQILDFDGLSNDAMERRFARERNWLIDSGWYLADEIADVNFWNELKVTRRGIRNHYTRIPLKHMAYFASQTGLRFDSISTHHPIPAALASIESLVDAHVDAHVAGTTTSTATHWWVMRTPDYKRLRHRYLHFSSFYGNIANAPQFTNDDPMNGTRERVVQDG